MQKKMNIVVIGTGMYAVGRGTNGFGTILPAIGEWARDEGSVNKVFFVSTNANSSKIAMAKAITFQKEAALELDVEVHPTEEGSFSGAYKEVISSIPKPACAIIVVPDHLHFSIASDCLNAGLPILLVKPLTPTVEEGKKLVQLVEKKQLYAVIEFHKRLDRANLLMRDSICEGQIGELLYCVVEYSQRKSIPSVLFKEWAEKTNILQYLGVHYIDIIRFFTKAVPLRVMATGQKKWLKDCGLDTYDSIQCHIDWQDPNGRIFTQILLTNWIDPECSSSMSDQKIKIIGTKGRLESDQKNRGMTINIDEMGVQQPNPDFCMRYGARGGSARWEGYGIDSIKVFLSNAKDFSFGKELHNLIDEYTPTFHEALYSTAVIEAANKSLELGNNWIEVEDISCE